MRFVSRASKGRTVSDWSSKKLKNRRHVAQLLEPLEQRTLLSTVTGAVFADSDGNGVKNGNEQPLMGVTVYADLNNNGTQDAGEPGYTTSDSGFALPGTFLLTLPAGSYTLRATLPSGWTATTSWSPNITRADHHPLTGVDLGAEAPGTVFLTCFNDLNANGTWEQATESVISGRTVYVDLNQNNQLDSGEPQAVSAANGGVTFKLLPGTYHFRQVLPTGWEDTTLLDKTVPGAPFGSFPNYIGSRFATTAPGAISVYAYNDLNKNSAQNDGESDLSGQEFFLDTNNNGKLDAGETSAVTGGLALYPRALFDNLQPGIYHVRYLPTTGWAAEGSGEQDIEVDYGVAEAADFPIIQNGGRISGTVYVDTNGNQTRDTGELPLPSVTVFLDTNNNGIKDPGELSTTTLNDGSYSFLGLKDGSYTVQAVTPATYVSQKPQIITISGGSNATASFGFYKYATVSGVVFFDKNANGIQDTGEPGLSNLFAEAGVDLNLPFAIFSVTFGANGAFTIGRIPPSTVPIESSLYGLPKPAWHATTPDPVNVTVHSGQAYTGLKFGFAPNDPKTGTIVATAFTDTNGNGVFDAGESTYSLGGVFLDLNGNGKLDLGEPSDARGGGEVVASGLAPGSYQVRDVPPTGYHVTTAMPHVVTVTANGLAYVYIGLAKGAPLPTGSITGSVFQDKNGNGNQDTGEAALAGWTVYDDVNNDLKLDAGDIQTLTNSSGKYTLSSVPAGTANVRIVLKSGWVKTNNPAASVIVSSGATASGPAFGVNVANAGNISGVVFDDTNADGIRQHAEIGMGGFAIYIDSNNDGKLDGGDPSATTDINGNFTISGLAPGTYVLHQVPNGPWFLVGNSTASAIVKASQTTNVLLAETSLAGIKGTVYNDLNANTFLDTDEPPLAGVRVFLDLNKNGTLDAGEPSVLSDASGAYAFTGLHAGTYRVAQQAPLKGMAFLSPVNGHIDLTVYSGNTVGGITLGQVKITTPVTFSGAVFKDLNLDAKQETGEPGLSGWKFYVDYNNNSVLDTGEPTAISNSTGLFTFKNIPTGRYLVRPIVPGGWRMDGFVAWFANSDGKNTSGLNFAASQTAWIGGRVFNDYDSNGTLGYDDAPLSGWTLYIDANKNGKLDAGEKSFTTAANGNYNFNGLAPGTYTVRIVLQAGFKLTTVGSFTVTVAAGQSVSQNFGVQSTP